MASAVPSVCHEERPYRRCRSNQLRVQPPYCLAVRKKGVLGPKVSAIAEGLQVYKQAGFSRKHFFGHLVR